MAAVSSSPCIFLLLAAPKSSKSTLQNQPQCSFLRRRYLSSGTFQKTSKLRRRDLVVRNATPEAAGDLLSSLSIPGIPGFHLPGGDNSNSWFAGIVGLCVTMPLLVQRIMSLTKEIDVAAQTVEKIADAVEHVAEEVDKAAEGIGAALPDGGLKKVVHFVEELAEETAKDAQKVEDLMDKVEELDDKLEEFLENQFKGPGKA